MDGKISSLLASVKCSVSARSLLTSKSKERRLIVASIEDARTNERTNDMSFEKIALGESGAQAHELLGESNTEMAILVVQEWWGISDVVLSHARRRSSARRRRTFERREELKKWASWAFAWAER